ncbi:T9SS type A sorting domain-containing protein [candidate division KSB1 bacterium]|nr:T9SS type A sorting domain-containing protein [candidate division KSB1 bacterium]NIR70100.1 T9SS type A sorting domain-containing protein [candidate division KSB1 bacterium]NIS27525.1 T9SS type A sorting domain-containing protein [candidate division KSB1 bacterium]NIT74376.1 T9SS type A sorting domain-containing protein [candidate division KSB1 bacterium]NIU28243.1 T9SS type A sorting domain-containing protein [candidate division KSB1 bacterium]
MLQRTLTFSFLMLWSSATLFAQVTGLSDWDIYLDPGHSQTENMGIFGYSEAEKNLRVGLHLRDLLLTKTDIDTVYNSRFTDTESVSLTQRTDEANRLGAAWFHSIHSDAGPPQLNSTLLLWGQLQNGLEKTPNGGKALSDIMVDILSEAMRTDSRGSIGDCSFYGCTFTGPYLHVNRNSAMPSELSEAGFHTSPLQNPRNMNEEWKRLEAYAFFWSILEFHEIERPPVGIATGFIYDVEKERSVNGAHVKINGNEYITDTYESLFHQYSTDPEQLQNGFYFIEGLPNDTLEMIVEADGFYSDTGKVVIVDTFFTFIDIDLISSVPPVVVATIPENDKTLVPIWQDMKIDFSRRMNRTASDTVISIEPEVNFTTLWSNGNRTLIIKADTLMNLTEYTVTINGSALDLFDHSLDGNADGVGGDDFSFRFTTQPVDIMPPVVSSVYPPENATGIENPPIINFLFDERLDDDSISQNSIILERTGQPAVSGTLKHYVVNDNSLLSFFPAEVLETAAEYTIRLQPGLADQFGNAIQTEQMVHFTTDNLSYEMLSIDNFETNVTDNWWAPQQSGSTGGIISEQTSRGTNSEFVNLVSNSNQSMQLNYGWDTSAGSWLIRDFLSGGVPRSVTFDNTSSLQMYIFGDGSHNKIRFALDDRVPTAAASNHEVSIWYTIDWVGWRLITWDLSNDPVGSWIGDGRLDGTLRIDSIQLTYQAGAAEIGTLYFDDLRLVRALPTSVSERTENLIPTDFTLFQNFPNPFNPTTTIRFTVANKAQPVKLVIYDMLGRVVRILTDDIMDVGEHSVRWDGKSQNGIRVASGTYIYKLEAEKFIDAKKMIMLK